MITAESFPIHAYKCPICSEIHQCTKEDIKYMDKWVEECPKVHKPVRVTNMYFIDIV